MPLLGTATKQPREIEKYAIYYGDAIDPTDTFEIDDISIVSLDKSEITGLPVIDSYVADLINRKVIMFISGGTAGSIYKVTVLIMTDSGRKLEDEFKLKVKDY